MKSKKISSKKSSLKVPIKSRDIPATAGMLREFKREIFRKFDSQDAKLKSIDARFDSQDAKLKSIDARFERIDARFESIDARFDSMDARFDSMDARFVSLEAKMDSALHGMKVLVEEQNAKNNVVLEALLGLSERQSKLEENHNELRDQFFNAIPKLRKPKDI